MGLLSLGTPLAWEDSTKYSDYIRTHGIQQLIASFRRHSNRQNDPLLWGDELEYMVVEICKDRAKLSLRQNEILDTLIAAKKRGELTNKGVSYHQEYGRYMLEATPSVPYGANIRDLLYVEANMEARRSVAKQNMERDELPLTITTFPRMGCPNFICGQENSESGPVARSLFLPDNIINTHVRFPTLTANIRERRGCKVAINVPLFKDTNTPWPFHDPYFDWNRQLWPEDKNAREGAAKDNHIYMDAMGFGMGCCCLQVTMQAANVTEARNLYDQLAPLTPIMLALSASAPFYRGLISDQDVRWNVISGAVDDRTPKELRDIDKSRYDSISSYIGKNDELLENLKLYNDVPLEQNPKVAEQLEKANLPDLDSTLIQHFAHLFIRDPLVIFEEILAQDDTTSMDHFENIQSTNWQTMRFKPPPITDDNMGWRVEFRSMDVQLTDFENAAMCIFVMLVARVILHSDLILYQPLSQVDNNMRTAHRRGAVLNQKFWWRKSLSTPEGTNENPQFVQLTIDEIINGSDEIHGLLPLIRQYLEKHTDKQTIAKLERYLKLISDRASGKLDTAATWMRKYVNDHPEYKHDSVISEKVQCDLLKTVAEITGGRGWDSFGKSLFNGFVPQTDPDSPTAGLIPNGHSVQSPN